MKFQFQDTLESIVRGGDFLFISGYYVFLMFIASMSVGLLGSYFSIHQFLSSRGK
jgi:hypothetical protein